MSYIQRLNRKLPHGKNIVDIDLKGQNTILIGNNGSGKTSLLKSILVTLDAIFTKNALTNYKSYVRTITSSKNNLKSLENDNVSVYERQIIREKENIKKVQELLEKLSHVGEIEIENVQELISKHEVDGFFYKYFDETRSSVIASPGGARGLTVTKAGFSKARANNGNLLEQYLVEIKNTAVHSKNRDDFFKESYLNSILNEFEGALKYLLEDDDALFVFNENEMNFRIQQEGKDLYGLQTLSSGYRSILNIYAEIFMQSQVKAIPPSALEGIVIIDELDAHLHVSLQRKILPFLFYSFPKVQFIVTTHSPFILQSDKDILVYNISTLEATVCDLSIYSYSNIVESLLGINPASVQVEKSIDELSNLIGSQSNLDNLEKINDSVNKLKPALNNLNNRGRSLYATALNLLQDNGLV